VKKSLYYKNTGNIKQLPECLDYQAKDKVKCTNKSDAVVWNIVMLTQYDDFTNQDKN